MLIVAAGRVDEQVVPAIEIEIAAADVQGEVDGRVERRRGERPGGCISEPPLAIVEQQTVMDAGWIPVRFGSQDEVGRAVAVDVAELDGKIVLSRLASVGHVKRQARVVRNVVPGAWAAVRPMCGSEHVHPPSPFASRSRASLT